MKGLRHRDLCLPAMLAVLVAVPVLANVLEPGTFRIHWEDGRCWLQAREARVNAILAQVSATTGIPIIVDPEDTSVITVTLADRDIEELMRAINSNANIIYAEDPETGEYYIEKIITSSTVDPETKQKYLRDLLVTQQELEKKLSLEPVRPVRYSGIGARVALSSDKKGLWVRPMHPTAPAAKAGLRTGDLVVAIEGRPVADFGTLADVVRAIRGPANSTVALTVRQPDGSEVVKSVTRKTIEYGPKGK